MHITMVLCINVLIIIITFLQHKALSAFTRLTLSLITTPQRCTTPQAFTQIKIK